MLALTAALAANGCASGPFDGVGPELAGTYEPAGRDPGEALILHRNGTFSHEFVVLHRLSVFVVGAWQVTGHRLSLRPVATGNDSRSAFPLEFDVVGHGASWALVDADAPAARRGHVDMWHRVHARARR